MRWIGCGGLLLVLAWAAPAFAASATLAWTDASTNEMGFNIERKDSACAGTAAWTALGGVAANVATYRDTAVAEGGTYCYRVNAWNTVDGTANGTKQYSAWSNTAGITLPFSAPAAPGQLGVIAGP